MAAGEGITQPVVEGQELHEVDWAADVLVADWDDGRRFFPDFRSLVKWRKSLPIETSFLVSSDFGSLNLMALRCYPFTAPAARPVTT